MAVDWTEQLGLQLTWHWDNHLRPRLEGLTDDEYLWEPVEGCWSVRPRSDGTVEIDYEYPEPEPPPVTTIAWRLGHVIVGIFGMRNAAHFGGPPVDYQSFAWSATAGGALAQLDDAYARWTAGVASLDPERLARPVGAAEGPFAEHSYAELVLHINREAIHHGAEVLLLRDLYRSR
jgi:DinB superfamily